MRTLADLQTIARATGCTLRGVRRDAAGELVGEWECPDVTDGRPFATAALLSELTRTDDPIDLEDVGALAYAPNGVPAAVLAWVHEHVRFEDEAVETFASPAATVRLGFGDCDDSARVLLVLARTLGVPGRFVFFVQEGQPAHVTAQLWDGRAWRWAETTIAARFGEHPFAAMARLGLRRSDLDGTPWILVNLQPRPLRSTTMGKLGSLGADAPGYLGSNFDTSLIAWSRSIGVDPLDALKLMLSESGLQPTAYNASGAAGINQLMPMNYGYFSPLAVSDYLALTAEEQLPYAFAYWKKVAADHNLSTISGRDLYWLNFLPATFEPFATPDHVITSNPSPYYLGNTGLDHGGKGYITAGDLQQQLDAQPGIHTTLWPLISSAIVADGGGGVSAAMAASIVLASAAVGVLLVRPDLVLDLFDGVL